MIILQDFIKQQTTEITRLTEELQRSEEQWMSSTNELEERHEARISSEAESAKKMERGMEKMMKEYEMKVMVMNKTKMMMMIIGRNGKDDDYSVG